MVHPQEANEDAERDLLGNPIQRKKPKPAPPAPGSAGRRETPVERATAKRLDRTARFYEHIAPPAHAAETQWRHARWAAKRSLVRQSLASTGTSVQTLANFDACGSTAVSQWSAKLGRRRLSAYYCHCRHCEPCARSKANKIAANLKNKLAADRGRDFRFITLTLKHTDTPLLDQIKRLFASFKKLRLTKPWKESQRGGAFMLEVKHDGHSWHPHLHAVVQGRFVDKVTLSGLWHKVTGDSFIVDIRKIDRGEDAAHYVTKYITKSTNDGVWSNPNLAAEWVIASRGLRTCNTFGSWRKFPLLDVDNDPKDWVAEDSLVNLIRRANAGELAAVHILADLRPAGDKLEVPLQPKDFPLPPDPPPD